MEPTANPTDFASHLSVCKKLASRFVCESVAGSEAPLASALTIIYSGCLSILTNLKESELDLSSSTPCTLGSGPHSKNGLVLASSAMQLLADLVVITSHLLCAVGSRSPQLKTVHSPASVAIALAPYWAEMYLITQLESANAVQVSSALGFLLSTKMTRTAACEISHDALIALKSQPTGLQAERLKLTTKTALASPLFFAMQLGFAMRNSLEAKAHNPSNAADFIMCVLEKSDANTAAVVHLIVQRAPQLCLATDCSAVRALPLSYVSCFHSCLIGPARSRLALQLCKLLAQYAPSAGAISDHSGLYPIHYASSFGLAEVLALLTSLFPYTAPLRDPQGLLPLHRALRRSKDLTDAAVLHLCATFPDALSPSPFFKTLEFASTHCSPQLYEDLKAYVRHLPERKSSSLECAAPDSPCPSFATDASSERSAHIDTDTESISSRSSGSVAAERRLVCYEELSTEDAKLTLALADGMESANTMLQYADSLLLLHRGSPGSESTRKRTTCEPIEAVHQKRVRLC